MLMPTPTIYSIHQLRRTVQAAHGRKLLGQAIAKKLRDLNKKYPYYGYGGRAIRMDDCSTFLEITYSEDKAHISRANYCRDRLCPMCAWRRSRNNFAGMMAAYNYIRTNTPDDRDDQWLMLTLTIQNCTPENLSSTIDLIMKAWDKISKRRTWRNAYLGYARSLEITYNVESNTMHPHLHVLLHASPSYYDSAYMDTKALEYQWISALGTLYPGTRAYVWINKVRQQGDASFETAIAEISKYLTKPVGIPAMPQMTFHNFARAVAGRRLVSLGGDIAAAAKALKYEPDEVDTIDTINADQTNAYKLILIWSHTGNAYFIDDTNDEGAICQENPCQ